MPVSDFKIVGPISPPLTPFKDNEDIDLDKIKAYVDHHVKFGVFNVFVCGSTGEAPNMTVAERKLVAEAWMREGRAKLSAIIAQVGASNLRDSMELAKHAEEIGADAICAVGTSYFQPTTVDDYVEYMRQVAAAAPNTPFMLYDIDYITGIKLSVNDFFHKGRKVIPTLKGVKYTSLDLPNMHFCHMNHRDAGIQIIPGTDEIYLETLAIGMETVVGGSYHGKMEKRLKDAFDKGDLKTARKEQENIIRVGQIRRKLGLLTVSGTRSMVKMTGLDLGPPRLPLEKVSAECEAALRAELQGIGYFQWGCE